VTHPTIRTKPDKRPIWERLAAIGASVPAEVWDTVPSDLSENLDHYLAARTTRAD
jgi:hypothetical protein